MKRSSHSRAFTLIELLVVISIIGLLASIIVAMFAGAKSKANDAKKMATAKMVNTAIQMDFLNFNSLPNNYLPIGPVGACPPQASNNPLPANQAQPAYESTTCPSSNDAYRRSMQELVNRGTYSVIPTSLDGNSYGYFNDDRPEGVGAIFSARLDNNTISTGGSGTNVGTKPNPPSVSRDDTTNKVTGMDTGMEYSLDGGAYTAYNATTFNDISFAGNHTLKVRIAESGINPASDDVTLTFLANIAVDYSLVVANVVLTRVGYGGVIMSSPEATSYDLPLYSGEGGVADYLISLYNSLYDGMTGRTSYYPAIYFGETKPIVLTAVPGTGSVFYGWGGECSSFGTNSTCTINSSRWSDQIGHPPGDTWTNYLQIKMEARFEGRRFRDSRGY